MWCAVWDLSKSIALAEPLAATDIRHTIALDIRAQSLATAIDEFCAATGAEVYYDGAAALGLKSSDLKGDHTHDGALRTLLVGTLLVPLKVRDGAYLLINPGDDGTRRLAAARSAQDANYRRYFAMLQKGVLQSLCRSSAPTLMSERVVIRLWIDPDGAVFRLAVMDFGESGRKISDIHAALRGLRLPEAPPPQMPQPVTVALLPGKSAITSYCPLATTSIGH